VAVGDINRDGLPDLVFADTYAAAVSVVLNMGNGAFQDPVQYAAASQPIAVALGDFNTDGILDIALADNAASVVSVLLGTQNGRFQARVDYAVGAVPAGIVVGDFNNDHLLDLATANSTSNTVSVLLGRGDGSFQSVVTSSANADPNSLTAADFNGDNKLDLAVSNGSSNSVNVLLGNGDGTFNLGAVYGGGTSPFKTTSADLNGDLFNDLVIMNEDAAGIQVRLGNGDGTFGNATLIQGGLSPKSAVIADLNGDSTPDIAIANQAGDDITVLVGNGNGTFQDPLNYAVGSGPTALAAADINGDGNNDLVTANLNSQSGSLLLGVGGGRFAGALEYAAGPSPAFDSIAQDINHDGIPDIVVTNRASNQISVLTVNGDGSLGSPVSYSTGDNSAPEGLASADLDGDGNPDIVTANTGTNDLSVFLGRSDGTLAGPMHYAAGAHVDSVAIADFNGDGKDDLAVTNYDDNTLGILLGRGDGSFEPMVTYQGPSGGDPTGLLGPDSAAVADFNHDGNLDIAVASHRTPYFGYFLGNGDGTFNFVPEGWIGPGAASIHLADFNSDGIVDLAAALFYAESASMLIGRANGSFQDVAYPAGASPVDVDVGDLNGDGNQDVISANSGDPNIGYIRGNGDGTFQTVQELPAGPNTQTVTVADFDGDSLPDVAVGDSLTARVVIILNRPDTTATHFRLSVPNNIVAGSSFSVTITALDTAGNVATDFSGRVRLTSSDAQALFPTDPILSNGVGSLAITLKTAGNQTISASAGGGTITGRSSDISVSPAEASQFSIHSATTTIAGSPLTLTMTALDAFGNTATSYNGTVHFSSSDASALLPSDTQVKNGTGSFTVTLKQASDQTVTIADRTNGNVQGTVDVLVIAASASHLSVDAPASTQAGSPFNLTVTALDPFGNIATSYAGIIHFVSSDALAALPSDTALLSGVQTVVVVLKTAGTQTVSVRDNANPPLSASSPSINVSPAPASEFRVSAPMVVTAGTPFSLTITALDPLGNLATSFAGVVHLTSTDSLAALPQDTTLIQGVKTVSVVLNNEGNQMVSIAELGNPGVRGSAEITVINMPQRFVAQVYQDLLHRAADSNGLTNFTNALASGALTRYQVVQIIIGSPEYRWGVVRRLYSTLLNRAPELTALNGWTAFLGQGGTEEQLQTIILASPEYFAGHGLGTNTGFLQALYQDVLGRAIEPSAMTAWSTALASGTSRTTVAAAIAGSAERQLRLIQGFYQEFLRRAADVAGLNAFVQAKLGGMTDEQVIILFVSSDEYFNRLR
jgi:hypothetical protein